MIDGINRSRNRVKEQVSEVKIKLRKFPRQQQGRIRR